MKFIAALQFNLPNIVESLFDNIFGSCILANSENILGKNVHDQVPIVRHIRIRSASLVLVREFI